MTENCIGGIFIVIGQIAILQRIDNRTTYDEWKRRDVIKSTANDLEMIRHESFQELDNMRRWIKEGLEGRPQASSRRGLGRQSYNFEHQFYLGAHTSLSYVGQGGRV